MKQKSYDGSASLYLVPTPIGNLEDITIRALNILKMVDFILCEDTRETSKLLNKYEIKKRLVSCHEFNEDKIKTDVVKQLQNGKNIALVTDQGTPIISDPGYVVVSEALAYGCHVIGLPGATAFVPALISSGINPSPFLFYGFLNSKNSKQIKELELLKSVKYTMIFYEAPHRIKNTLSNMLSIFGNRRISLHREISKMYEEIIRGKIDELIPIIEQLKGEFVLIVEGNQEIVNYQNLSIMEHMKIYLEDGCSEKEAMKIVAKERNVAKSVVYQEYYKNK